MCASCSVCMFCFSQKTAYEMRISDWSSDVCSSDLRFVAEFFVKQRPQFRRRQRLLAGEQRRFQNYFDLREIEIRAVFHFLFHAKIGRAWCRERVCPTV